MRALLIAAAAALVTTAYANPPNDADGGYSQWFRWVLHPERGLCCSIGDGRSIRSVKRQDGWYIWLDQSWLKVPRDAIVEGVKAPTGQAVVWFDRQDHSIRCFVPADSGV